MKKILLSQNKYALVDNEDYDYLNQWKWSYLSSGYAYRVVNRKAILLHKLIQPAKKGMVIDHINGDKLDNRKSNLRACTYSQNFMNSCKRINSISKYKGVTYAKSQGGIKKWLARIRINDKIISGGYFIDEVSAAKKYDELAIRYFGKFSKLNF